MADTLRIKRRPVGGAAGPPATLAASEIAYNEQSDVLYYGKGNSSGMATSIVAIGGATGSNAVVVASDTAPANAADNTLWFDTTTGFLFLRFNDGTSTQWIQV